MEAACAAILSPRSTGPGMPGQHTERSLLGSETLVQFIVLPALCFLRHLICLVKSTLPNFLPFLPPSILHVLLPFPLPLPSHVFFFFSAAGLNSNWDSAQRCSCFPGQQARKASSTCSAQEAICQQRQPRPGKQW